MKNLYKTITKSSLKAMALGLMLTGSGWVNAQMSGTVTIDASGTATSTNFKDWYSFWRSLQGLSRTDGGTTLTAGVSGPVTVNVKSSLIETSQIQFPQITGMSSTNTITIDGGNNFVQFNGAYEVMSFQGGDYFTVKNLTIRHGGNSNPACIRFGNASDYNTIDKCTLEFSALTSAYSTGSCYVAFTNSATGGYSSANSAATGSYCTISNNLMRTTNSNSPGPGIGVAVNGNQSNYSSTAQNVTVNNNTIENFYYISLYNYYSNGNQFIKNDISRKNTVASMISTPFLIYSSYTYASNRSTTIDGNNVHDLPYVGASASQGMNYLYGMVLQYNYGNSARKFNVINNTYKNIMVYYYMNYLAYAIYNDWINIESNMVDNVQTYASGSYYNNYGWYIMYGNEVNFSKNSWINSSFADYHYFYGVYAYQNNSTSTGWCTMEDNIFDNNKYGYYSYILYPYYGNWKVNRNRITNNRIPSFYGYLYCINPIYQYNIQINSNLVARNYGYYGCMGIYSYTYNSGNYTFECRQNTVQINGASSPYAYHYAYGIYLYPYYHSDIRVVGNIVSLDGGYGGYPMYTQAQSQTQWKQVDYNSYFVKLSYQYWYSQFGQHNNFNEWYNSGFAGPNEKYGDPNFVNMAALNYRSNEWFNQNSTPTTTTAPNDITGATRNPIMSDRGAMELYSDIAATASNISLPSSVCSGHEIIGNMTLRNLFTPDTAMNFYVAYSINGGPKVRQLVKKKILAGDTHRVWFTNPITLVKPGNTRLAVFIDIPDDNRSNDSFIFTTLVKPAPGGGKYAQSTTPTTAYYQLGRAFDVTQVNVPIYYRINAPRVYSNATYWNGSGSSSGKDWTASVSAITKKGKVAVSGATISQNPSGSSDMEVKFETANTGLEDSTITLITKITDLNNNCDTFIRRDILIYPTITPDFKFPAKICDGEDVLFEQKSTVRSGGMEFLWDFGTGIAADTSNAPEPVFRFAKPGTYSVKMTAKTLPYNFPAVKTQNVVVSPIPSVKFTKVNACEGKDVVFTNQTTPSSGVLNTWNFGDGNTKVDGNTTVLHKYNTAGAYTVTLTANLNGCIGTASQRVYQFPKPKAAYTVTAGKCDNDMFTFQNGSSIATGSWGPIWSFGDGNVSTEDNPTHKFSSSGDKSVKLLAISEFGCKDSVVKTVSVLESPKVSFVNTAACSRTATTFTNTTPSVGGPGGVVKKYSWNFGDGGTSLAENPSHSWSSLGPKTVSFNVELDNGCMATSTKELTVGIQPKAAFTVGDICLGKPAVFVNNTTWPQGEISYLWNFGDGNTSTSTSPVHTYNKSFSPNVTLYATIAGGCTDSIVINTFNVFEGPRTCDFAVNTDYAFGFYGIKLEPLNESNGIVGGQANVQYTWVFQGGGTNATEGVNAATNYDFQADGKYTVTMRARSKSAPYCECSKTKEVVMNRTDVKSFEETGVAIFPNPNNGQFTIALKENFGQQVNIEITNMAGSVVKSFSSDNTGSISVNTGDVADGTYLVRVRSGNRTAVRRITVRR